MPPTLTPAGTARAPRGEGADGTEPRPLGTPCGPRSANEVVIGMVLTATWMLSTGRRLDEAPLLHDLTADQLIDFWADDQRWDHSRPVRR